MLKPQKFTFSKPSKVAIQLKSFSAKNGSICEEIAAEMKFWRRIHESGPFVENKALSGSQPSVIWRFPHLMAYKWPAYGRQALSLADSLLFKLAVHLCVVQCWKHVSCLDLCAF